MAFVERLIDVTFTKATGSGMFAGTKSNTLDLTGLRVSADFAFAGTSVMTAHLRIFGMTLSQMNDLQTSGMQFALGEFGKNTVKVEAGDASAPLSVVFDGFIFTAFIDFSNAPDVAFDVVANTLGLNAVGLANNLSTQGPTDVGTIMEGLANRAGLAFQNDGVSATLSRHVAEGSLVDQIASVAQAAHIFHVIEKNRLTIWPRGQARKGKKAIISPQTGMWGYPLYTNAGIQVRTVYNPDIQFGGTINVVSSLTPANGDWYVYRVAHNLESQVPNGHWYSTLECFRLSSANVQPVVR